MKALEEIPSAEIKLIKEALERRSEESAQCLIVLGEDSFIDKVKVKCIEKNNQTDVEVGKAIGIKIPKTNNVIFDAKHTYRTNYGFTADEFFVPSKGFSTAKANREIEYHFPKNYMRTEFFDKVEEEKDAYSLKTIKRTEMNKIIDASLKGINKIIEEKERKENEEAYNKIDRLLKAKKAQKATEVVLYLDGFSYKGKRLKLEENKIFKLVKKHPEITQSTTLSSRIKEREQEEAIEKLVKGSKLDIKVGMSEIFGVPVISHKELTVVIGDGDIAKIVKYIEDNPDMVEPMKHESEI